MEILDDGFDALTAMISALKKVPREEQERVLQAVATFLGLSAVAPRLEKASADDRKELVSNHGYEPASTYSENRVVSAKEFLRDKSPHTDIERIVCLAYYLTHYREVPHFKTLDISTLNTEAAQPKFSNASVAVDNAAKAGFLVQATKGNKQISSVGEQYVQLLPDRDAARANMKVARSRTKGRKTAARKSARPGQK